MTKTKNNIGIFGFGVVGQGLYDILQHYANLGINIKKIGVKDPSKDRTLNPDYFTFGRKEIIEDPDIELIAELTDDEEGGFNIVKEALLAGKKVVSANKKMIANNLGELLEIQKKQGSTLLYEAAVCGSIPVIRTLEDYFGNELLNSVNGIFNGSSNYILSKVFNEHLDYDSALKEAQEKGFAESDPTLDVGGYDAKYKLAIVAAHAFGITVNPGNIPTLGIEHLSSYDHSQVIQKNQKLKLISKAVKVSEKGVNLMVLPQFVSKGERLYEVDEEYNAVTIDAPFSGSQFLVGQGAGPNPTGSAVLSDILAAISGYYYNYQKSELADKFVFSQDAKLEVYISFNNRQDIRELPLESISHEVKGMKRSSVIATIKLVDLIKYKKTFEENQLFVAATGSREKINENRPETVVDVNY